MARLRAEVLAEAGSTNDALAAYNELPAMEGVDDDLRERIKAAIAELNEGNQ